MYAITITRTFWAGHALRLPHGELEPQHWHNWRVDLSIRSDRLDMMDTVMDFHELEASLDAVLDPWRAQMLNEVAPFADEAGALVINPSAERVAEVIAGTIKAELPAYVWLHHVDVHEAEGCIASWIEPSQGPDAGSS